jgi:TetR/AcrR family transcriptional regulator, regulator of cefoperazone and chloramphenicol sensitivity
MTIDDTRQRLLDAAEQVFSEKGFKAASVREICNKAGANIAAINYYFGDKESLYIETVKYAHRSCIEGAPFPEWEPNTPPVQMLCDFIRVIVTRMHAPQSPSATQLMMREMVQPTAACRAVVEEYIQPMAQKLGAILAQLMPGTTRQQQTLVAFSIVGQSLFYRNHRAIAALVVGEEEFRRFDVDLVARHITEFTLRALGLQDDEESRKQTAAPQGTQA